MTKQSSLPPDWKERLKEDVSRRIEDEYKFPSQREPVSQVAALILQKDREITKVAEAVWESCGNSKRMNDAYETICYRYYRRKGITKEKWRDLLKKIRQDKDVFYWTMETLIFKASSKYIYFGSDTVWLGIRTKAEYLTIIKVLKIIREDHTLPPDIPPPTDAPPAGYEGLEISRKAIDYLIERYQSNADQASNSKKPPVREKCNLRLLFGYCRILRIEHWVRIVSPLMSAVFGPSWTPAYTKRMASAWNLHEDISEYWVKKDGRLVKPDKSYILF